MRLVRIGCLIATAGMTAACGGGGGNGGSGGVTPPASPPVSTSPYPAGLSDATLQVAGVTREYRVHVPSGVTTSPTAVVLVLHGGGGEAKPQEAEAQSGADAEALAVASRVLWRHPQAST